MKGYTLRTSDGSVSLKINRPGPNEGQEIMKEFRTAIWQFLDGRHMSLTFFSEIVKNIIDHSDRGYMLVVRRGEFIHFFSDSFQDPDVTPAERKLRRPIGNFGFFTKMLPDAISGDSPIVDQFSQKDYNYQGRIIEPPPP